MNDRQVQMLQYNAYLHSHDLFQTQVFGQLSLGGRRIEALVLLKGLDGQVPVQSHKSSVQWAHKLHTTNTSEQLNNAREL